MRWVGRDWSGRPSRTARVNFPGDSFIATLLPPTGCRGNPAVTRRSEGGPPDDTAGEVRRALRKIAPVRFPLSDRCSPFHPVVVGTGIERAERQRVLRNWCGGVFYGTSVRVDCPDSRPLVAKVRGFDRSAGGPGWG
jgi:hypothetical protein